MSNKCTIYVDNYLFPVAFLHVSMFVLHPQGVSYYVCCSYKVNKMETFIK